MGRSTRGLPPGVNAPPGTASRTRTPRRPTAPPPTWCRHVAEQVGPACTDVIANLLEVNALFRLRAAQGVLGLRDKHTPARLETACAKAIAVGDPSYRTIKGILIAGTETTNEAGD